MPTLKDAAIRFNIRLDIRPQGHAEPKGAMMTAAGPERLSWRSPDPQAKGQVIQVDAEPNFRESFTFLCEVQACAHHRLEEEKLDYYAISADIQGDPEPYRAFLKALRKTCFEMKEDLRLMIALEARVEWRGHEMPAACENISYGGAFLALENAERIQSGERLKLSITLPNSDEPLTGEAQAVYVIGAHEAARLGLSAGVGVRLSFEDDQQFRWEDLIDSLHRELLG